MSTIRTKTKTRTFDPGDPFFGGHTNDPESWSVWTKAIDTKGERPVPTMPQEWVAAFKCGYVLALDELLLPGGILGKLLGPAFDQHFGKVMPFEQLLAGLYDDGGAVEWLQDVEVQIDEDGLVRLESPAKWILEFGTRRLTVA